MFAKLKESREKAREARFIICQKCGISKAAIDKSKRETRKRLDKMGIGVVIGGSSLGLLKCPKCQKITCSKCALELPGHSEKSCPFCETTYVWESVID